MALKDEVPDTLQGIKNCINYCDAEVKRLHNKTNRLYKLRELCEKKIKLYKTGELRGV